LGRALAARTLDSGTVLPGIPVIDPTVRPIVTTRTFRRPPALCCKNPREADGGRIDVLPKGEFWFATWSTPKRLDARLPRRPSSLPRAAHNSARPLGVYRKISTPMEHSRELGHTGQRRIRVAWAACFGRLPSGARSFPTPLSQSSSLAGRRWQGREISRAKSAVGPRSLPLLR
jgi:hypothetical protein